jgi:hypothetical protein
VPAKTVANLDRLLGYVGGYFYAGDGTTNYLLARIQDVDAKQGVMVFADAAARAAATPEYLGQLGIQSDAQALYEGTALSVGSWDALPYLTLTSLSASGTAPLTLAYDNTTGAFTGSMTAASATQNGYLSSTDWDTFNSKFSSTGGTISGDTSVGSTSAGHSQAIYATEGSEMAPALEAAGWTATNGWAAGSGSLVRTSNASTGTCTPSGTFTVTTGRIYKVVFTVSAVSGYNYYSIGGVGYEPLTATTYTHYITAANANKITFTSLASATCTITAVSVKELAPGTGDLSVFGRLLVTDGLYTMSARRAISIHPELGTVGLAGAAASAAGYGLSVTGHILASLNIYANGFSWSSQSFLYLNEAANTASIRNAANQQTLRVYNTYTNASNYERLAVSGVAGASLNLTAETAGTGADNLDMILTPAGTGRVVANGPMAVVSLADASAPNSSVYYSTTAGKLVYKDGGGVVNNLY